MNSWIAVTSGLIGVIVGVMGKYLADLKASHRTKLLDERIKAGIRFLDAVEEYGERVTNDYSVRLRLKIAEEEKRDEIKADVNRTYAAMRDAFKMARQAETALILVMPEVEDSAWDYLAAAVRHAWRENEYEEVRTASNKQLTISAGLWA